MKILRILLTIIHSVVIVLLLGTLLNDYISPSFSPWFNLLSLGFPILMIINVTFILLWILLRKKRVFIYLLFSLLLINPTRRWINFSGSSNEKPNLKIVSLNTKGGKINFSEIYPYLQRQNADVVLSQEYGSQEFKIPEYQYLARELGIVMISSKYEIIKTGKLLKGSNGDAIFADIKINGKLIRFVNVYLNPFSFDKSEIKPSEDLDKNSSKAKFILKRLLPTFKIHREEVLQIREIINNSPYPVILTGDFNAVPNSYEYYHLGKDLNDVFVEVGNGSATSFHDYKFPIRIDYTFSSKSIKPISYKVDRSIKISDHFPVIAEFKID